MSDPIIRVENLGKRYRIGEREAEPATAREAALALFGSPFRYLRQMRRPPTEAETLWALKGVSFEVQRGEVVGIIGRNGAGKSTLLKILSRITEPTEGCAEIHGRVGSLLEVGTGFHPELTGRENIYLSGTILGMRRAEIDRRFDEIVAFSEIERFLDTPVKRYSSGMYVRLGFAVAAHLEPEVLLVDEVLAVGDAAFQLKCLGKMGQVAQQGRTVLFVSHNMHSVRALCSAGIVLQQGQVCLKGDIAEVIDGYWEQVTGAWSTNGAQTSVVFASDESKPIQVLQISVTDETGQQRSLFGYEESPRVVVLLEVREPRSDYAVVLVIRDSTGSDIVNTRDGDSSDRTISEQGRGRYRYSVPLPSRLFKPGRYGITVRLKRQAHVGTRMDLDVHDSVLAFEVTANMSPRGWAVGQALQAVVLPHISWAMEQLRST